jgi:ubiquinone biosynthesis protein
MAGGRRQNLARLGEITQVAARHGFGYLIERGPGRRRTGPDGGPPGTRGQRVRAMLDELGPTFVKFGQLLSTRPDIVPRDIVQELRGLQDDARPMSFEDARGVLEAELGLSIEKVFIAFDETPIAAASIGQVHRATLPGGHAVVVKIQRPDAERQLEADLQLLEHAARLARDRIKRLSFIDLPGVVDELGRGVRKELDYRVEARNAEAVRRNFAGDHTVSAPRVYWRQTTGRVLTMEELRGTPLARLDLDAMSLPDRRALAERVAETWMQMVFVHGFFHADPHPANILVESPTRLGLVDFGLVGQLTPRDRQAAVRLLLDVVDGDADRLPRRLRDMGVRFPREREDELREALAVILQRYSGASLSEIEPREVLRDVFGTIYRLNVQLAPRWVLLDKALATLAGVGLEIYPDFNVFETARPYAQRMVASRFRPDKLAGRLRHDVERYAEALVDYPFQISELLDEFRDGEVRITINQEGFSEHTDRVQAAANRLALALVAASFFIGSAVVGAFVDAGPEILGLGVIALPGFLASLCVAGWLLLGIARSGRW